VSETAREVMHIFRNANSLIRLKLQVWLQAEYSTALKMYFCFLNKFMEQNIAILIADLAGYTALTETHGPSIAADIVDRFLSITEDCLAGDSKLHQRVGDEVMIVSTTADQLMSTALLLIQNCSKENHFLQLHGGLHYGKVLKRNDHYFGSPVNLTSRIANKANKGTFWCSSEFMNELSNEIPFTFSPKGKHNFKNVSEDVDVFELVLEVTKLVHIDPVCRMLIHKKENATPHPFEENIFFCSNDCLDIYIKTNKVKVSRD
jgi:adenylate cyclase